MELANLSTPSKKSLLTTPQMPTVGLAAATPDRADPRIRNRNFALSLSGVRSSRVSGSECGHVGRVGKVVGGSDESAAVLLLEKHEMLCEFFTAMMSLVRLFRLKRLSATLTKLSRSIESLTNRRFTLHHLAQLKYIVPEVIAVKKIRVRDEETSCMKEELLIHLETDAVETNQRVKGSSGFSHLKGIFRTRISDYASTHTEGEDVPEGELPNMFYKPNQEPEPSMNVAMPSLSASLTSPLFRRRFSSKVFTAPGSESFPAKTSSCLTETPTKNAASEMAVQDSVNSEIGTNATPIKLASTPAKFTSTPAEDVSTPVRLMAATPALRTPKRPLTSADDNSEGLPSKSVKRRVMFCEASSDDAEDQKSNASQDLNDVSIQCSAAKDLLTVLPKSLVHSLLKKEQKTLQDQDPILLQAKRRQQLMACAPKLFDMVQIIFQSIRRSVMTKEELIHKLITGHLDIVDREEVEGQLKLLQEVAPEFLSEQTSFSSDTLLRLNRASCADSVRAKLLEAK